MPDNRVPFEHPWTEDFVGNVATVTVGGTPSTSVTKYWGGDVPWMASGDVHLRRIHDVPGRITEMGLMGSNATMVEPEAVAVGLAGQGKTRGTVALTLVPLCTNQSVALIKGNPGQLDTRYLFHDLDFRYEELRGRSAGGGRAGLSKEILERIPVPLPEHGEQVRIAIVLDALDFAIAHTERTITKLKKIKIGLLHDLLTRGIDENGELRDPRRHPEQFHEVPGHGLVPNAWDTPCIDDISIHVGSGLTPTGGSRVYKERGILFIRSQNVTFDGLLLDDVAFIDEAIHRGMARSEIFPHDVLINITGASIGRCCPVPDGFGPANVNQHVCAIRIAEPCRADAVFLSAALASHIGQHQIDMYNAGSNRQGLNYQQLRGFVVPWPRDPKEREQASAVIEAHDLRVRREERSLQKLKRLKHGLMQDLLSGRKRVSAELISDGTTTEAADATQREANIYFRRAVLAAEIVQQFHELPTFGSVKFQKALFLCERAAGLDLETRYHRAAAGPHDNRLMRSVDSQLERQRWFRKVPREQGASGNPTGWRYQAMENAGGHRQYFDQYWTDARDRIQRVLDVLKRLNSERCEIVATLYSAWEDLLAAGDPPTDDAIVDEVLTNWHESKQAISRDRWMAALGWIREQGLTPTGKNLE